MVDPVRFGGEAEGGGSLDSGAGVEDFVGVGGAEEAGDCGLGDVLPDR